MYWALQAIAVAWLMFIVHEWFICMPDFSYCTDEILPRMSINSSLGERCKLPQQGPELSPEAKAFLGFS